MQTVRRCPGERYRMVLKPWRQTPLRPVESGFGLLLKKAGSEASLFLNPQRLVGIPEPFDV